jgi:hypothetical protein
MTVRIWVAALVLIVVVTATITIKLLVRRPAVGLVTRRAAPVRCR